MQSLEIIVKKLVLRSLVTAGGAFLLAVTVLGCKPKEAPPDPDKAKAESEDLKKNLQKEYGK